MQDEKDKRSLLANRLRRVRGDRRLSQRAVAERLGVDQATVSRIESGGPYSHAVGVLADAFCREMAGEPSMDASGIAEALAESEELRALVRLVLNHGLHK